jgi:hypothetical protein
MTKAEGFTRALARPETVKQEDHLVLEREARCKRMD